MAEAATYASEGKRADIVQAAQDLGQKYMGSAYLFGGKTTSGFDCSYFVYLVFNQVFPDYKFMDSAAIVQSQLFKEATLPNPGDIIFFTKGTVPYEVKKNNNKEFGNHVGIVLTQTTWIGRQTSKLGIVNFNDLWWWPRGPKFYSYAGFDAAKVSNLTPAPVELR